MALKTDYKDALFPGQRRYQQIINEDGTLTLLDVTNYTQSGDKFGANDVNAITDEINTLQDTTRQLNENKADKTQIPTQLPANGGNADTVDNLHAVDFVQNKHLSLPASELNNPNYTLPYIGEIRDGAEIGLPSGWWHICYFSHANHDGHGAQLAVGITNANKMYMRTSLSNTWQAWQEVITSANINAQNVNYASAANYANSANNANYASSCGNAAQLEGRTAAQILLLGEKHLAGQGAGGGYSFAGDGAEDTGMFSDFDGDLYFKQNDVKWYAAHSDHNHDSVYSKATNARNGAGHLSIVEGDCATASGSASHAEGDYTTASGVYSHAEGSRTTASGASSHAENNNTTASGDCSHAEGYGTIASKASSHAEGFRTEANEEKSHAEGYLTIASGWAAHAEGYETIASGVAAHSSGRKTLASGIQSAAFGTGTQATGWCSFTIGKYNIDPSSGNTFHSPFIIGRGADDANRANAFRVYGTGQVYAQGAYNTGGADYAEFFEWLDNNSNNEDRVGYFVTLDKDKIKIANSDDYILGIISAAPSIIGNSYDDQWCDMYLKDEWGRVIYEEVELPEELDEEGNIIIEARKEMQPKLNPVYNNSKKYVGRSQREEWSTVGMLGQLLVRDDGTCKENGYCKCGDGGIATAAETGYRVLTRVSDNIIKILFR